MGAWSDEYRKAINTNKAVVVQQFGTHLAFYYDTPKRVSQCKACHNPIIKGADDGRFVLVLFTGNYKTYKNGGGSSVRKFFFHPVCVTNPEVAAVRNVLCHLCGKNAKDGIWVGGSKFVCVEHQKAYGHCDECYRVFSKAKLGKVANETKDHWGNEIGHLCDECSIGTGVETLRTRHQREVREAKFNEKYDLIVASLKEKGFA